MPTHFDAQPACASQPNVLIIVADDMGFGDLACFGNDAIRTPHLDKLASNGTSLLQHYTASPICAPARAGLLTGRYPHRTGAIDVPSNRGLDRIALDETTIADAFRSGGYRTGMIGKWHNGFHDPRFFPRARGFDEFIGFCNGGLDYYRWVLDWNGEVRNSDGRYLTDVFTECALDFIDQDPANPFFLYLAYNAPHSPLQAPEEFIETYRKMGRFTEEVCRVYAMIEVMDRGIGEIVERLAARGQLENTLILFTSDNGPFLHDGQNRYNGPWSGAKTQVLEGGIRVPAIVHQPGRIPAGVRNNSFFHFCDWMPTLLSWCGVQNPKIKPLDGIDRSSQLQSSDPSDHSPPPGACFWQFNRYNPIHHHNGAMREGEWKLLWPEVEGANYKDQKEDQPSYEYGLTHIQPICEINPTMPNRQLGPAVTPKLFRLGDDPAETKDLAPTEPEQLQRMIHAYDSWFQQMMAELKRCGGPEPVNPQPQS